MNQVENARGIETAPSRALSNVLPFTPAVEPLAYSPGVTPFDRTDPAHIRAWNTLFALGWSEQRFREDC